MDTSTAPRKRGGRQGKLATISQRGSYSPCDSENMSSVFEESCLDEQGTEMERSILAVSPPMEDTGSASAAAATTSTASGECRRSSRKKIIKFDVRDLLNKNRKSHKIQIEARIDSNVPAMPKPNEGVVTGDSTTASAATSDLTTKQKNFIEKSAIFRRFSVSAEQQTKAAPLRPPNLPNISLLNKVPSSGSGQDAAEDLSKIAQAHRLNRTKEIFNATMLKSKQNSSLIIAQMESSSSGSTASSFGTAVEHKTVSKRKSTAKAVSSTVTSRSPLSSASAERKEEAAVPVGPATSSHANEITTQKRRGRPPKNKTTESPLSRTNKEAKRAVPELQTVNAKECDEDKLQLTAGKPKNWQEYKACLKTAQTPLELTTSVAPELERQEDVILEISSSSSASGLDVQQKTTSKQHNFDAISFLQEDQDHDEVTPNPASQFIIAAVEEITTEVSVTNSNSHTTETVEVIEQPENHKLGEKSALIEQQEKQKSIVLGVKSVPTRHAPSSSESEGNSEHSSGSKPYKKGDKLRVSLKRISMPQSPTTSTSSAISASSVSSDDVTTKTAPNFDTAVVKGSTAKRSKRLQKKPVEGISENLESKEKSKNKKFKRKDEYIQTEKKAESTSAPRPEKVKNAKDNEKNTNVAKEAQVKLYDVAEMQPKIQDKKCTDVEREKKGERYTEVVAEVESTIQSSSVQNVSESGIKNDSEKLVEKTCGVKLNKLPEQNLLSPVVESLNSAETRGGPTLLETYDIAEDLKSTPQKIVESAEVATQVSPEKKVTPSKIVCPVEVAVSVEKEIVSNPIVPPANKKEMIKLPPKKQASKLKLFESFADNNQQQAPTLKSNLPHESEMLTKTEIIQNVSVETSTLLDILRTVQQNKETAGSNIASEELAKSPKQSVTGGEKSVDISYTDHTNKVTIPEENTLTEETPPRTSVDDKSESSIAFDKNKSPRDSPANEYVSSSSRSASSRGETGSPYTVKKVTRRYERRSRRGEETTHKTLEETFAEIAAQSSKEILEMAAKAEGSDDEIAPGVAVESESQEEATMMLGEKLNDISIPDIPVVEESSGIANTAHNAVDEDTKTTMEEMVEQSKVFEASETITTITEDVKVADTTLVKGTLDNVSSLCEETLPEPNISSLTMPNMVQFQPDFEEPKTVANINCSEMITLPRRGRKTKNNIKPVGSSPPANAEPSMCQTLYNDGEESKNIENPDGIVQHCENVAYSPTTEELVPASEHPIQITAAAIATNKEERIPMQPPKKRLSKIQIEFEDKLESPPTVQDSCESNIVDAKLPVPLMPKKTGSEIDKDNSSKKNKKAPKPRDDFKDKPKHEKEKKPSEVDDSSSSTEAVVQKRSKQHQKPDESTSEHAKEQQKSDKQKHKKLADPHSKGKVEKQSPKFADKDKLTKKEKSERKKFLQAEVDAELCKQPDEKTAKKKRQKKLKEAFEAALKDDLEKSKGCDASTSSVFKIGPRTPESQSPVHVLPLTPTEFDVPHEQEQPPEPEKKIPVIAEPEDDPDPLKDIEKFIEAGVNLLKRDYKIDDDSVDEVMPSKSPVDAKPQTEIDEPNVATSTELVKNESPHALFETPADTPISTPCASPPPKSPTSESINAAPDETMGVRRSHRIKQITKAPKALVGRGLVRDKERFSKNDDETKSHYTLDDHLTDLAEVEAQNAKFLKEMEERLSNFQVIKENEYKCERIISREARKMICDCFLTSEEEERGELGCGEDCLNRLLMIECGTDCNVRERCTNKRFQKFLCSPCRVFRTEKKGFGIMADIEILPGEFIMEYVGEVIDGEEFERRRTMYSLDKNRHYYFMALRSDAIIDATIKGNISRFINHSCDPNAETQKWTVNGELRIGFFSRKSIMPGEEITFDYQYQRYGREAQRCYCESANCRGWIGEEPNSDEGEQVDEDSDEENLAESLLNDDDEDDTDVSVDDAEEVQKKLEIAAAEAKLTPMGEEIKEKLDDRVDTPKDKKKKVVTGDEERKDSEEDPKSKFKKLLSKMAEKVATKKQQKQKEKKQRKQRTHSPSESKSRFLEDPDIEDEVNFLSRCGLKNQSDTLRLSRLMVRAKLPQTRLNLLQILRKGDLPCRRLFLDYHGLRLLHGWMSEDGGDMNIRLSLLETLETLPIVNKTVLTDSKVYQAVRNWCGGSALPPASGNSLSPSDDSSKESSSSNSQQASAATEIPSDLQKLASKLTASWDSLPDIFRIPKRERIEQMKEHEREADRQYAAASEDVANRTASTDRYQRDRFGRSSSYRYGKPYGTKDARNITIVGTSSSSDTRRRSGIDSSSHADKHLSKEQRREMFAAKVARDEAEKRLAEERREFDTKCRFFGLDPKKVRPQDVPFCVNPATGQWYTADRRPIPTPPSYAHVQVPVKLKSTNPADYQLPAAAATLPAHWKYAITPQGKIYYYHVQYRIPQWEPPTPAQIFGSQGAAEVASESESEDGVDDSSEDNDELLIGMDQAQLKAYIEKKIEMRRQKRYNRLVDERAISPRREEDRIYNQLEVRKYKENKEKIRKRKEEIRRKRADTVKNTTLNMCTLGSLDDSTASGDLQAAQRATKDGDEGILPIQDYLLSSDEEENIKAECNNSPLIDKIVQGDKIVDELDALATKRPMKRPLPPHRDLSVQASTSGITSSSSSGLNAAERHEQHKKRKLEKKEKSKKSKESDSKYRKLKEKFRCEIAGIIVHYLKPYRKDSCLTGRIQSDEDFNHLARKLTHFVMIKELKYCESVGQTLVVTESVKNKSREFIKKYMAKYGDVYVKPHSDPEFKDIPFSL